MVGLMLTLTFWHLGLTIRDYHRLNKDMKEFMSGVRLIKPHSVISILDQATDFREADHHGSIRDLSPFYHGLCYYALQTGSLYIGNYEPNITISRSITKMVTGNSGTFMARLIT